MGSIRKDSVAGPYGLGEGNERGEIFTEWCKQNEFCIMNTWFKRHKRRLYTWISPDKQTRNQIDYICINKRFRNAINQSVTKPSVDCNSGHQLLF